MRTAAFVVLVACLHFVVPPMLVGPATAETDFSFGTWTLGRPAPGNLLATHPTLLRNNKILVIGGSSYNCCFRWGKEEARCKQRFSKLARTPFRRAFVFTGPDGPVQVDCRRSMTLIGDYSCSRAPRVDF